MNSLDRIEAFFDEQCTKLDPTFKTIKPGDIIVIKPTFRYAPGVVAISGKPGVVVLQPTFYIVISNKTVSYHKGPYSDSLQREIFCIELGDISKTTKSFFSCTDDCREFFVTAQLNDFHNRVYNLNILK